MSETFTLLPQEYPDTSKMILEDDEPLDSFINEKQQRGSIWCERIKPKIER